MSCLGSERQDTGEVTKGALIIISCIAVTEPFLCGPEGGDRPRPISEQGKSGADMGPRKRAVDAANLPVMKITQTREISLSRSGEDIKGIRGGAVHHLLGTVVRIAPLMNLGVIAEDAPVISARDIPESTVSPGDGLIRNRIACSLGPRDEIGHICPEPG